MSYKDLPKTPAETKKTEEAKDAITVEKPVVDDNKSESKPSSR